jgi:hypothetical protein
MAAQTLGSPIDLASGPRNHPAHCLTGSVISNQVFVYYGDNFAVDFAQLGTGYNWVAPPPGQPSPWLRGRFSGWTGRLTSRREAVLRETGPRASPAAKQADPCPPLHVSGPLAPNETQRRPRSLGPLPSPLLAPPRDGAACAAGAGGAGLGRADAGGG